MRYRFCFTLCGNEFVGYRVALQVGSHNTHNVMNVDDTMKARFVNGLKLITEYPLPHKKNPFYNLTNSLNIWYMCTL